MTELRVLSFHSKPVPLVENEIDFDPLYDRKRNKEKLSLKNATASELAQEPDITRIANPLAVKTWTSTIVFGLIVVAFLTWVYWIYCHYMEWCKNSSHTLPDVSIVTTGIPIFLLCILVEWIASIILNFETFRLNDTTCAFSNGLYQQMLDSWMSAFGEQVGISLITAVPYKYIFDNYRIADINGTAGFVLMFFARDFCYYWFHYFAHRCAFLWAIHGVHHQPNEFNMSVNLSQGALQRITAAPFYMPLAFFFSPELYILIFPVEKIYGFLTHTKLINNCYGIANFFVTPSSHRVHHGGRPAKVIDKNFGEVLTIWDTLFGTFQEEQEPIVFGHVMPIESWDPFEAQIGMFRDLYIKSKATNSWIKKVKCFICSPGYNPTGPDYELIDSHPYNTLKYDSTLPGTGWTLYALIHHIFTVGFGILILRNIHHIENKILLVGVLLFLAFSASCNGRIWDRNRNVLKIEVIRLILFPFMMKLTTHIIWGGMTQDLMIFSVAFPVFSLISIAFLPKLTHDENKMNAEIESNWIPEAGRKFKILLDLEKKAV